MTSLDILKDLLSSCFEAHDAVDGYVDVVDGSYGEPAPNWAMQLQTSLERAINRAEAHLKTLEPEVSSTTWTGLPYTPPEEFTKEDRREMAAETGFEPFTEES